MERTEIKKLKNQIFSINDEAGFLALALQIFEFQYNNIEVYHRYCDLIGRTPKNVNSLNDIPFMPIDFFRSHRICCEDKTSDLIFTSSGTTGNQTSRHEVPDPELYIDSFLKGFKYFYGDVNDYCILALLPSYLERSGSSLVYMADNLIKKSKNPESGFYLHDLKGLAAKLERLKEHGQKTLLIGVTYALLDLAASYHFDFPELIIMETGGMKGKRKEMVREEVHQIIKDAFHCPSIHSEYGMTELLSQAYSDGDGIYTPVPWMKVLIRDMNDPLSLAKNGESGGINVIDLANIYSCSFIAIQDIGKLHEAGKFEVLGRFDQSLVRGCNLMVI